MIASYAEAITIGERAGTPVQISHIKLAGAAVHGMSKQVIELVEAARARGVRVTADQYPYIAGSTSLSVLAPVEMRDGDEVLDQYCKGEGREELRAAVETTLTTELSPEKVLVSVYPWRWWLQGKTLAEIAADRNEDPVKVGMDLACGPWGAGIYFSQNEADVRRLMARDWVATASDGSTIVRLLGRFAHPRLYGTFPRKLRRYAYDEKVVSLSRALRSMTELPARIFSIPERGRLELGYFADVVVFDPETLRDVATFEASGQDSEGIEYLLVNGVLSIDGGEFIGKRVGRALRRNQTPAQVAIRTSD
jgi:N-acyl-D-aspartate/D-glutamate deacylase